LKLFVIYFESICFYRKYINVTMCKIFPITEILSILRKNIILENSGYYVRTRQLTTAKKRTQSALWINIIATALLYICFATVS